MPDIVLALSEVNCLSEEPKKTERAPAPVRRTDIPADTILIGKKPIMARVEKKPLLLNFVPEGHYYWV